MDEELRSALATIAATQRKHGEEVDSLTRAVTRLTKAIEQEDTDRFEIEQRDQKRHRTNIDAIDEMRDAFKELVADNDSARTALKKLSDSSGMQLTREQVVAIARMLVDELRQGLAFRAMGATPWPPAVPPSDARVDDEEGKKKRTLFRIGSFHASWPDPTLKTLWTVLKYVGIITASGYGGWRLVLDLIKANAGGHE